MESKNFILRGSAPQYYWKGAGLFSIKTFQGGPAYYNTGNGSYLVGENSFLLLNHGTEYSIEISSKTPVNSFCLFFDDQLVKDFFSTEKYSLEKQLDNIGFDYETPFFFERTYDVQHLDNAIRRLKPVARYNDCLWLEQEFFAVLQYLNSQNRSNIKAIQQLKSLKPGTRNELYRRLLVAREYMHANFQQNITLAAIGAASGLSVNHLIRCFSQAFGCSPHKYLSGIRLGQAKHLLLTTGLSVSEIMYAVGHTSPASFSLLFKTYSGYSPEAYRKINAGR